MWDICLDGPDMCITALGGIRPKCCFFSVLFLETLNFFSQEQPLSEPSAEGPHQPHGGVQPGPARLQVHPAEAGEGHAAREAAGLSGALIRLSKVGSFIAGIVS